MKNKAIFYSLGLLLLFGCSDKKFNSEKWKTNIDKQFYMLNDLVESEILLDKTKTEVIDLLDTVNIKKFKYSDNSWMFIILIPNSFATEKAVEVMDIDFENEKVKQVTIR
ncbi:MAG: hypothetical protein LBQ22_06455 [Bacteroidales bacterium]|jgi:hypothetical protein|nr:hypothetical protein [Bacteroidales bacterium]